MNNDVITSAGGKEEALLSKSGDNCVIKHQLGALQIHSTSVGNGFLGNQCQCQPACPDQWDKGLLATTNENSRVGSLCLSPSLQ